MGRHKNVGRPRKHYKGWKGHKHPGRPRRVGRPAGIHTKHKRHPHARKYETLAQFNRRKHHKY